MEALSAGLGLGDAALWLNRVAVGAFFGISGFHKLFFPQRHMRLRETLIADRVPFVKFNEWFVPAVELLAGAALVLGFFSTVAALLLGAICLVALWVDGLPSLKKKYAPFLDTADYCDCVLYLPETLYGIMLVVTILAGPGPLRLT